jgi:lipopolysaccharide assembly outer membrane protein LptD (OstA)
VKVRPAALFLLMGVAACNPAPRATHAGKPPPRPTEHATAALPPLHITGKGTKRQPVSIVQSEGGRTLYRLTADSYDTTSTHAAAQAMFFSTHVTFYDPKGATLDARAPRTFVDERRKQVTMSGGVHARSSGGLTLACDELVYDRAAGRIHGSGNVLITGDQNGSQTTAHGNQFDSDITLTQMVMK